jgi:SAM-dependent methyltransferase
VLPGGRHPGLCSICGPTRFQVKGPWLRDEYVCSRCGSIPRMRSLVRVLKREIRAWRTLEILEVAPDGPASAYIAREAATYTAAQYFEGVASGEYVDGVRREDLQRLSYPDGSLDVLITQDVFEHVLRPDDAWSEIGRVLRPGGCHLWTVPIFAGRETLVRVVPDAQDAPELLMTADYHGNPLGGGSLVIHEWGDEVISRADATSGMTTTRFARSSTLWGIHGEMHDVLLTRKPG